MSNANAKNAAAAKMNARKDAPKETPKKEEPKTLTVTTTTGTYEIKPFSEVPARRYANQTIYPFADLAVGQYFFVPNDGKADLAKRLSTIASTQGRQLGKKFSTRTMKEEGVEGAAVYCVEPDKAEMANA